MHKFNLKNSACDLTETVFILNRFDANAHQHKLCKNIDRYGVVSDNFKTQT